MLGVACSSRSAFVVEQQATLAFDESVQAIGELFGDQRCYRIETFSNSERGQRVYYGSNRTKTSKMRPAIPKDVRFCKLRHDHGELPLKSLRRGNVHSWPSPLMTPSFFKHFSRYSNRIRTHVMPNNASCYCARLLLRVSVANADMFRPKKSATGSSTSSTVTPGNNMSSDCMRITCCDFSKLLKNASSRHADA